MVKIRRSPSCLFIALKYPQFPGLICQVMWDYALKDYEPESNPCDISNVVVVRRAKMKVMVSLGLQVVVVMICWQCTGARK